MLTASTMLGDAQEYVDAGVHDTPHDIHFRCEHVYGQSLRLGNFLIVSDDGTLLVEFHGWD